MLTAETPVKSTSKDSKIFNIFSIFVYSNLGFTSAKILKETQKYDRKFYEDMFRLSQNRSEETRQ